MPIAIPHRMPHNQTIPSMVFKNHEIRQNLPYSHELKALIKFRNPIEIDKSEKHSSAYNIIDDLNLYGQMLTIFCSDTVKQVKI